MTTNQIESLSILKLDNNNIFNINYMEKYYSKCFSSIIKLDYEYHRKIVYMTNDTQN